MVYRRGIAAAIVGFGIGASGCGVSAQQACTDLSNAVCAQMAKCTQTDIARNYGDTATCQSRQLQSCLNSLTAANTGATPATTEACVRAYPNYDCESYLLNMPPTPCLPQVGQRDAGATCATSAQCQTTYCGIPTGVECGTCAPEPGVGSSCVGIGCGRGLICADDETCASPVFDGGACGTANPCADHYACVGSTATSTGICLPEVSMAGSSCDPANSADGGPTCDPLDALVCQGPRGSRTCLMETFVGPGEPCGYNPDAGVDDQCSAGAACIASDGGRQCVPPAPDNAACDTALGPPCTPPARCITGGVDSGTTAGTCKFLTPSDCQ
jgi:hypothetical protein